MAALECDIPDLFAELRSLLSQIPAGYVTTYGDLAAALGNSAATRWVGEFLLDAEQVADCPAHRVVRRTGELGRYFTDDPDDKQRRLERESVSVRHGRVDLDRYRYKRFSTDSPLQKLTQFQETLPGQTLLEPFSRTPKVVAGVDLSYISGDSSTAVGAYVEIELPTKQCVYSTTVRARAGFPYIPGYLAFREIPVLWSVLQKVRCQRELAEVIFVDGNGRLHPRRAGIATHLGIAADVRTIGVGKKLLCGDVDLKEMSAGEDREVIHRGEVIGTAVKGRDHFRPVFVSPGQRIDVAGAVRLAKQCFGGHRVPEPIYWADRLSRQTARGQHSLQ